MSKIEERKAALQAQRRMVDASQSNLDAQRKIEQDIANEIAALEAEASKPREWLMNITPNGKLTPCRFYQDAFDTGLNAPITVIEKKPVRVTLDMANKALGIFVQDKKLWLEKVLKAAGIDAIAAD